MGGTKRMSMEEKRKVILGIYHKTQQVYTEKEIIALAAKEGVNTNSIPDVHQSLIDDGLVEKSKIGGSNYCWSFPAKKDWMAQKDYEQTLQRIEELKPKVEEAKAKLADAKRGREEIVVDDDDEDDEKKEKEGDDGDDSGNDNNGGGGEEKKRKQPETRASKLARLSELTKKRKTIEAELDSLKENDPAALADLEKELRLVTDAANRWTDNIFICKQYLVKKRGMDKKEAMKILGITDAFDYPEEK